MSHTALRRVVIRLLHDVSMADRLARDPAATLGDVELSADERAWLLAVPPDAWRTDADRPRRVLAALADEYPAAVGLAPSRADTFFRSPCFHAAVQERGSLAVAFGRHFLDDADARVVAVARLELAAATLRRAPRRVPASAPGTLRLAPHAAVVRVAGGAADLLDAIRAGRPATRLARMQQPMLVVRAANGGDVTIEGLEEALAGVLERAAEAVPAPELVRLIVRLGGSPEDAPGIVAGLRDDRLLI
jgi:hypothetical protein